jgi:hypothetical protein
VTGLTISLVVVVGILAMISLAACLTMIWWTTSSQGRHSISGARAAERTSERASTAQQEALETTLEMARATSETARVVVEKASEIVSIQATLTETLLLGRPTLEIGRQPDAESETETQLNPSLLLGSLPGPMQEAIVRDRETAGAWPSLSETLHDPSANGAGEPGLEILDPDLDLPLG